MKTAGFIGTGNMGRALAGAVAIFNKAAASADGEWNILLANRTPAKAEALSREIGGEVTDNRTVAACADYIFLGVKPQMMADMLAEIAPVLKERAEAQTGRNRFVLVTMAAGLSMEKIAALAGGDYPVIRIMPNTPASIGEGVILYSRSELVSDGELREFTGLLSAAGQLSPLPEHLIDAGSAVSGCGPAFVYMFIEALADGGVACGLPRKDAYAFAAQMVAGSAKMVLQGLSGESGMPAVHPGALKDAVCSPGGTTIQGVRTLEEAGFRGAVMDAVVAAYEKTLALR